MQQHVANLFARSGAARFARDGDSQAVCAQRTRQLLDLRALATAVETFKGNKLSARGHLGMIAGERTPRARRIGAGDRYKTDILTYCSICIAVVRLDHPEGEWDHVVG